MLTLGDCVVHIITHDSWYRQDFARLFKDAYEGGQISFGPLSEDKRIRSGGNMGDANPKFVRETDSKDALVDFLVLALCDDFYGTTGSTVTHYVRAQNERMNGALCFGINETIGDYTIGGSTTMKFRLDVHHYLRKNLPFFQNTPHAILSHQQQNVLDFLNASHLKEIYTTLTTHLLSKGGRDLASASGQVLSEKCRVANLNRKRFKDCETAEKGQHWLKALLNTRLFVFCVEEPSCEYEIHFDDATHELCLIEKDHQQMGSSSASSSSAMPPPQKKMRMFE